MSGYFVENFGCRATQADGASIEQELVNSGFAPADGPEVAQVVVLNSCTVTAAADADLRSTVRRIHRENPDCKILVTGCYAQRAPEEVAALPGVTWVVDNSQKQNVPAVVASAFKNSVIPTEAKRNEGAAPAGGVALPLPLHLGLKLETRNSKRETDSP